MATDEKKTVFPEGQKELSKRDRAFLGQLPDDFLRVREAPRSEQSTHGGHRYPLSSNSYYTRTGLLSIIFFFHRDHPHLVPMTFNPQNAGLGGGNQIGKLKVTIAQVSGV